MIRSLIQYSFVISILFISCSKEKESKSVQKISNRYSNEVLKTEKVFSIGGETNDPRYMLSSISDFCVDKDGYLYGMDPVENHIRIFDKNGSYIKKFGRKGHGPGEFAVAHQIEINHDGYLIIYDGWIFKFNCFSRNGDFFWSKKFNKQVWEFRIAKGNKYIIETHQSKKGEGKIVGTNQLLTSYTSDWKQMSVLFSHFCEGHVLIRKGNKRWGFSQPFSAELKWSISPEGNVAIGAGDNEQIIIKTPEGKQIRSFKHNIKRQTVKQSDIDKYWKSWKEAVPGYVNNNIVFPDYKPFFKELYVDDEGYIILKSYEQEDEFVYLYIYSGNGEFINKIKTKVDTFVRGCIFKDGFVYNDYSGSDRFTEIVKSRFVMEERKDL